jgi:hypothetical protein
MEGKTSKPKLTRLSEKGEERPFRKERECASMLYAASQNLILTLTALSEETQKRGVPGRGAAFVGGLRRGRVCVWRYAYF